MEVNLSASLTYKKYSQTTKFRWPFDLKELTAMRKSLGNHPFLVACLSFWERKLLHFLQIEPAQYAHPINTDTFYGPSMSVLTGFDCISFSIQ